MALRKELYQSDMSSLFDTHCHLFLGPLNEDTGGVLERARTAGVERLLVPAVSSENWSACGKLSLQPGIDCALGVHPWRAGDGIDVEDLRNNLIATGARAIGEIGLDWKADVPKQEQHFVFVKQIELASTMNLPVILHCRNAFEEMLEILDKYPVRGVIHAWSRDFQLMDRFIRAGLCISFGGAITREGAKKARESARLVPSDRFVLETDSPSIGLSGVPYGKSEPRHVADIARAMALIREEAQSDTVKAAWKNSVALFGDVS